tara:strand:- start:181 stop:399 length:219 start_codon:yes stop_codon:yes gene_type:complete
MFKEGDLVEYKKVKGKVIFVCELSLSILVGDEFPRQHQCRVVVYNYEWESIKKLCDSDEIDTRAETNPGTVH